MKILEIIIALSSGGGERFVVDLSNQLAERGHSTQLLTFKATIVPNGMFYKGELSKNVNHIDLGIKKMNFISMWKIYKIVKEMDADIVHMHLSAVPFFCIIPILFYKKPKYVVTQHIVADYEKARGDYKYWIKKLLIKFHRIELVAIGIDNRRSIKNVFHIDSNMIINGRDPLKSTVQIEDVRNEIKMIRTNKDTILFCNIARFDPQKNHKRLVRCFKKLIMANHNIALIIIGAGFDSEEGQLLQKNACEGIYFLGEKHNVSDYLILADCFCLSSDYEGMPITLLEALSCGCIPVGTPVSGFNDFVEDGVNGFVSKDFSDEEFERTIIKAEKEHKNIDRNKLKDEFQHNYTMEICAHKYEDFFKGLSK